MKDEELFKAWKSEQYKDQSDEERFEFVEHLHTFPKYFEQAFLAGLKAGRPQWHDLRKDPNDLPKDDGVYLVYTLLNEYFLGHYEHNSGYELSYDGTVYSDFLEYPSEKNWLVEEVTAWCEIPNFDKE